jgi:hypothetical protein
MFKTIRRGIRSVVAKLVGAKLKEDLIFDHELEREGPDHKNYRRISSRGFRAATRDLPGFTQDEQNRQANKFFVENPWIRRLAKMVADFLVGNGVSVQSKDEQVQAELDAWWSDPVNNWEQRHYNVALEFGLYGEQIPEVVSNVFTGRHRYNWLDPLFVACAHPHPKFPTIPASMDFWSSEMGGKHVRARILNGVPEPDTLAALRQDKEPVIYYFATNRLTGALRGHSNFYPLFEWADVMDNAAFTLGERMVILLTFVWHLKADNLDAEQKRTYREKLENAQPSSSLITNKNVELTAVTPDLKSADFAEGVRLLKNIVAGAAGVPEHFMGEGGDVNFATAKAMSLPTLRSFLQQQREYIAIIRTMARGNLASVARKGRLRPDQVDEFTVQVDPMNPQDTTTVAGALNVLVTAMSSAKLEGWVNDKEAQQAIRNVLGGIVELDEQGPDPEDVRRTDLEPGVAAAFARLAKELNGDGSEPTNGSPAQPQPAAQS